MINTIDKTIRDLRQRCKLTQSDLVKKLGITRNAVNAWEMGVSMPSLQNMTELSKIFCVSVDYILGIEEISVKIGALDRDAQCAIISIVSCMSKQAQGENEN